MSSYERPTTNTERKPSRRSLIAAGAILGIWGAEATVVTLDERRREKIRAHDAAVELINEAAADVLADIQYNEMYVDDGSYDEYNALQQEGLLPSYTYNDETQQLEMSSALGHVSGGGDQNSKYTLVYDLAEPFNTDTATADQVIAAVGSGQPSKLLEFSRAEDNESMEDPERFMEFTRTLTLSKNAATIDFQEPGYSSNKTANEDDIDSLRQRVHDIRSFPSQRDY